MKKALGFIAIVTILAACEGAGDRTDNMPTVQQQPPTSDPNQQTVGTDTSANRVQDSTTVIDYDTAARKH